MFRKRVIGSLVLGLTAVGLLGCGPAAEATATTAPASTATSAAPATATGSVATATSSAVGTVAGVATATKAALPSAATDVKLRPVAVLPRPAPDPNAQRGGTFRWLWNSNGAANFHPWQNISHFQTAQAYDTLLNNDVFEAGKGTTIMPALSNDWWTDATGTTWTFTLRRDVKFSDGQGLTCADIKFSIDTVRLGRDDKGDQLTVSPRASLLRRVASTSCADDYTLQIKTDGQLPSLAASLTSTNYIILPKHTFEGNLKLALTQVGPGTGPFTLQEYKPTETMTYKRNPQYWDQPYPYVDLFQHIFLGSNAAELAAFRVGRGELMDFLAPPPGPRAEMVKAGWLVVEPLTFVHGLEYVQANWQKEPWNDKRFSLALQCAINAKSIIDTVVNGEGFEAPVFPFADQPGGSQWGITKEEWKAIGPCHGPTAEANMDQRRQIARDLLAQMGFNAQNPARPNFVGASTRGNQWTAILNDLQAIGIEPKADLLSSSARYDRYATGDFDLMEIGIISGMQDPDHWLYELFYSSSDRNYGKYTNAELDALIDQQSKTLDPVKRKDLIKQLSMIILKDNASIRYDFRAQPPYHPVWLKNYYLVSPYTQTTWQQFKAVWIDQDRMKQAFGG